MIYRSIDPISLRCCLAALAALLWPLSGSTHDGPALSVSAEALQDGFACTAPLRPGARSVLLVHGTSVTPEENWAWSWELTLPAEGFATCTVRLPDYAFVDIQESSEYVVHALRRMAEATGNKVSIVGISQGGLEPRWAIRWWPDVRDQVDDLVMLATPNHGGPFANLVCTEPCLPALWQQSEGSAFLTTLNEGDETPGGVSYTSIYSLTDWVIQPAAPVPTARLEGAVNLAVQEFCPGRPVDHIQHAFDAAVYALAMDALRHPGPLDTSRVDPAVCLEDVMPGVDPVDAWTRLAEVYVLAGQRQSSYEHKVDAEPPLRDYALDLPGLPTDPAGGGAPGWSWLAFLAAAFYRRRTC